MRSLFLYNSILFLGLPFCDQKGSEKVSLLRGSEPRLRGYSPLRTQRGGSEEKILKNAGVLHFS